MPPQFLLIALATFASEDLTCIATGVLISQHRLGLLEGILACTVGIFSGDMLLFLAGRLAGAARILRWVPEAKLATVSHWIEERGLSVVLISRFTPGLRLPAYLAAGLLRSRFWSFTGYFLLASLLWTPLLVAGTAAFGVHTQNPILAIAAIASVLALRRYETRRRAVGFLKRKLRWEFWPACAAYLPVAPYFLWLSVKHRSLTLFTAANPGIPSSGLIGESKSAILRYLSRVPGAVPEFTLIPVGSQAPDLELPIVLKPDVGERGAGVSIVRTSQEVTDYLANTTTDTIAQRYVPGCEFGVYYVRFPDEAQGRVLYVTEKRFPTVTGDGRTTLRHLILCDPRAVAMAGAYFRVAKRPLDSIPAVGEQVQLVEIGSHCRGTIFLDGSHLITPELTHAFDRISQAHPDFHLGRYDVRTPSADALSRGEFQVIELNGVSAEATHVYDPAVSLIEAYRVIFRHWRTAFEIGATHRDRGVRPMSTRALLELLFPILQRGKPPAVYLKHVA